MKKYTEKQLISFGNYLLSSQRTKSIQHRHNLDKVLNEDLENWKVREIDVVSEEIDSELFCESVNKQSDLISKELASTNVIKIKCSTKLKNILRQLLWRHKDQSFKNIFESYTLHDIRSTRGIGNVTFKELEALRIKAGLNYKN